MMVPAVSLSSGSIAADPASYAWSGSARVRLGQHLVPTQLERHWSPDQGGRPGAGDRGATAVEGLDRDSVRIGFARSARSGPSNASDLDETMMAR
jgi:hypothetical protein